MGAPAIAVAVILVVMGLASLTVFFERLITAPPLALRPRGSSPPRSAATCRPAG